MTSGTTTFTNLLVANEEGNAKIGKLNYSRGKATDLQSLSK